MSMATNPISRRALLQTFSALSVSGPSWAASNSIRCDVAVIGGGTGGCAAALAALRNGMKVVMTEETAWIGGQLTSQSVPPDEHPWIESFGATRAYRAYRESVRRYYRDNYPLTREAQDSPRFNPGGGSVSVLTHEPKVSLAVLEAMLAPYVSAGQLALLRRHKVEAADVEGARVRSVRVKSLETGTVKTIDAAYFVDATELGDLLPLSGTEFVTGFEPASETGELNAPAAAQPANHQAFTVCFALGYEAAADHTIDKPDEYAFWRDYVPAMRPPWPGKLLSWSMSNPITLKERAVMFDPTLDGSPAGALNLWIYRRIVRSKNFQTGFGGGDATLVNWPQNDYWLGNLYGGTEAEAAHHLKRGKNLSLSLVYWMQTEAPRPDGGQGWKGLRLRPDITGTEDGLAMYPYIRESRRIRAEFTVLDRHVGTQARMKATGKSQDEVTAERFDDSVGVGSYRIDLHPSSGGDNYIDVSSLPFQIPLGALIPRRMDNLLAGCKNLGVTHITNGCYRLHPVEWNIGEAAGAVAAHCVSNKLAPRQVRNTQKLLREFQASLTRQGVETEWPRLRPR
jgi:hypothetical protein